MGDFYKCNVSLHEYYMHKLVYDLNIVNVPKIISYDNDTEVLIMQKLGNCSVADYYGENIEKDIFDDIRDIIRTLYDNNIEYPDITGRNFIEYGGKLWIINFEYATQFTSSPIVLPQQVAQQSQQVTGQLKDPFVKRFISRNLYQWNPRYVIYL